MRISLIGIALTVATAWALGPEPIQAQTEELKNDGWSSGQSAAFQSGFAMSEMGAVRLVPTFTCPTVIGPITHYCVVQKVTLLFGPEDPFTSFIAIHFWNDPGTSDDPGASLTGADPYDVFLPGLDDQIHEVTLSPPLLVTGPFRVGIEFPTHDGPPSIARDTDGTIASARNFIYANFGGSFFWFRSSDFGVSGDWIIRATLPEPGRGGLVAGVALLGVLARTRRRNPERRPAHSG